jgi:hypothetical protein
VKDRQVKAMRYRYIAIILVFIFMNGCSKARPPEHNDIIAYVNKEPVYESDVRKEIFIRGRTEPDFRYNQELKKDQLNIMINKKLVIQEAMKRELASSEKFADTMKAFWEQTLVRDFIALKKRELGRKIIVTQDEIKKYYDKLSEIVTFRVLKSTDASYIKDAYNKFVKKEALNLLPFETLGPIGYDDGASAILLDAFELPVNRAKTYSDPPYHYLIIVDKKDVRDIKPLETVSADIEKKILDRKESDLFEKWLKTTRRRAKVDIIKQ